MGDSYNIFEQAMMATYPQYVDLSEDMQTRVRTIAIIILTYKDLCGCPSEFLRKKSCEDERELATRLEMERYAADAAGCRNQGKNSRCLRKAANRHATNMVIIEDEYRRCLLED